MTTLYLIRHAQSDNTNRDQMLRPLTEKGQEGAQKVAAVLGDVPFQALYASTYLRTQQTLQPLADLKGLKIVPIYDLRERELQEETFQGDFDQYMAQQWADFSFAAPGSEFLQTVQQRNLKAIRSILRMHLDQIVGVGSHGCAMSTILDSFIPFGFSGYSAMRPKAPCIYRLQFDGERFISAEEISLVI
jgi:broad specificity phosphatase PhoE